MSGVTVKSRDDLLTGLVSAGIAAQPFPGGTWSAPAVLISGASPWIGEAMRDGTAEITWRLLAVGGGVDAAYAWDTVLGLVDELRAALLDLRGWRISNISPPGPLTMTDGRTYLAAEVFAQTRMRGD